MTKEQQNLIVRENIFDSIGEPSFLKNMLLSLSFKTLNTDRKKAEYGLELGETESPGINCKSSSPKVNSRSELVQTDSGVSHIPVSVK